MAQAQLHRTRIAGLVAACLAGLGLSMAAAGPAVAAPETVNSSEALVLAIQNGSDPITFGSDIVLEEDLPDVSGLTIDGAGHTLDGSGTYETFFTYGSSAFWPSTTIRNLTIANSAGSGIYSFENTLTVENVTVTGSAEYGIQHYSGMGISITDSVASNNAAGGVSINTGGHVSLSGLTASGNGGDGLGVYSQVIDTFERIVVSDNDGLGLSMEHIGRITINGLTATGNGSGGVAGDFEGNLHLINSTISGNSADDGAGISTNLQSEAVLTLVNTTVSGNVATAGSGALSITGGAGATVGIAHSTITANFGSSGVSLSGVTAAIDHSIIADNPGVDLTSEGGELTVAYSIVENPGTGTDAAIEDGTGNIVAPALLGPLGAHGGATLTHLPLAGSPAIEAGDPAITDAPATDQRGLSRVVGTIEIGAVEVHPGDIAEEAEEEPAALPATGTNDATALGLGALVALFAGAALTLVRRRSANIR